MSNKQKSTKEDNDPEIKYEQLKAKDFNMNQIQIRKRKTNSILGKKFNLEIVARNDYDSSNLGENCLVTTQYRGTNNNLNLNTEIQSQDIRTPQTLKRSSIKIDED